MSACGDTLVSLAGIEFDKDDVLITKSLLRTGRDSVIKFDCSLFFMGESRDLLILGCEFNNCES